MYNVDPNSWLMSNFIYKTEDVIIGTVVVVTVLDVSDSFLLAESLQGDS